jgi:hypothetical protein
MVNAAQIISIDLSAPKPAARAGNLKRTKQALCLIAPSPSSPLSHRLTWLLSSGKYSLRACEWEPVMVTRDEAAQALDDIATARDKIGRLKSYNYGAPYLIVWGLVWLVANAVTQFEPDHAGIAWPVGVVIGLVASTAISFLKTSRIEPGSASIDKKTGRRVGLTSLVIVAFVVALNLISQPETSREINATISIFFPFAYMAAGIWLGWRLFAIGLVTALAILIGYFYIGDWFALWMGVFGGGSLIAGGLWLRSA